MKAIGSLPMDRTVTVFGRPFTTDSSSGIRFAPIRCMSTRSDSLIDCSSLLRFSGLSYSMTRVNVRMSAPSASPASFNLAE